MSAPPDQIFTLRMAADLFEAANYISIDGYSLDAAAADRLAKRLRTLAHTAIKIAHETGAIA